MKRRTSTRPTSQRRPTKAFKQTANYSSTKRLIEEEIKNYDTTTTADIPGGAAGAGRIIHLTNMAAGTGFNNRVGTMVKLKHVQFKGELAYEPADSSNVIQYKLIRWDAPGTPVKADIVSDLTYDFVSFTNINNIDKIKVLRTGVIAMNDQNPTCIIEGFVKLNWQACKWDTSGNADSGHIYLALFSDSAAASHPQVIMKTRVRYIG